MPEPQSLTIRFPQPAKPLSVNEGGHWAARRRRTKPWWDQAYLQALIAVRRGRWTPGRPITVQVVIAFRDDRRRDPHNYTGTVVKAVVDGLVKGGLIPDDTVEWATVIDPTLDVQRDRTKRLEASIIVTERTTP